MAAAISILGPQLRTTVVPWNSDNCALPECICLPAIKTIDCSNQQLRDFDLEYIPLNYFIDVEVLDLSRNHLSRLPSAGRILALFPQLQKIFLAENPSLNCLVFQRLQAQLAGTGVKLLGSLACRPTHPMALASTPPSQPLASRKFKFFTADYYCHNIFFLCSSD